MDEDDLRRTLGRLAHRASSAAAVAQSAQRTHGALKAVRARLFWPVLAAAAAVLLVVGTAAALLTAGPAPHVRSAATPLATASRPSSPAGPAPSPAHFEQPFLALDTTVAGVTEDGPRPPGGWKARLGSFGAATPVTLCLVAASRTYDAMAVTPDGKTWVRWPQSDGTMFMFPT